MISGVTATDLEKLVKEEKVAVFDVRKENEFVSEHITSAQNTQLDFLNDHLDQFPENRPFYIHCAGGYRSVIAASILKKRGIHNLINIIRNPSTISIILMHTADGFSFLTELGLNSVKYRHVPSFSTIFE